MSEPITTAAEAVAALGALPMPVGTEAQADDDRAKAPWGRNEDGKPLLPMGAHWTDIPELVDREVGRIRARVDQATSGHWRMSPVPHHRPGTVATNVGGVPLTVGQCTMRPADLELVLHAHDDLSWCLDMIAKFRGRIAELEAERHTTNEALDDAVQALRGKQAQPVRIAKADDVSPQVTKLRALLAGQRESLEDPHDGPLAHRYLKGRDLPGTGGTQ